MKTSIGNLENNLQMSFVILNYFFYAEEIFFLYIVGQKNIMRIQNTNIIFLFPKLI